MSRDNQKNLVQFCRELGLIVNEILNSSNKLLSALVELLRLYRPKLQDEAEEFYDIRFNLPDSVGLLCDIQKITMPDDDEFYDSVAPLCEMALDIANRMVSANVIINDIITMYFEPSNNDMYIHLCLTMLNPVSNSILYIRSKLENYLRRQVKYGRT
ncbi:hypothetical protein [Neobacillus drentensis]|uniref:hypothetical protein n=1 Tax=Neobacillus drentensis TaxID=220684 RepID=UPI0030020FCA